MEGRSQGADPRDPAEEGVAFRPAEATIAQDWGRLAHYLRDHGLELDLSRPPRQFAGGYACYNYRIELASGPAVLRRPPAGPLPRGAYDIGREFRVLSALHPLFPLAPRALHCCLDAAVLGAPFLIMEYRPGLSIREEMPAWCRRAAVGAHLSRRLVEVLAALHRVDPGRAGLAELGRPEGFLLRTLEGWARRLAAVFDGDPPPPAADLLTWLRQRVPGESGTALIHNDFKLDNLLLDPETLEPRTLVDWDMATRGDPLFDLAVLTSYWTEPGDHPAMAMLGQMPSHEPGFLRRTEVVALYGRETGRDVSDFAFYRVLALYRLAGIFAQLHRLWRHGSLTGARYASFDRLAAGLLDFAWEVARGRMF